MPTIIQVALPDKPPWPPHSLALSNLVQIPVAPDSKVGETVHVDCWRPNAMRKYRLQATLIGFESRRLLEIDTEEKIGEIADTLAAFCRQ
jgi:hypothetical protein